MADLLIVHAEEDAPLAAALAGVLADAGHAVQCSVTRPRDASGRIVVALWTRHVRRIAARAEADGLSQAGWVVVLGDPPDDMAPPGLDLRGWAGDRGDPRLARLIGRIEAEAEGLHGSRFEAGEQSASAGPAVGSAHGPPTQAPASRPTPVPMRAEVPASMPQPMPHPASAPKRPRPPSRGEQRLEPVRSAPGPGAWLGGLLSRVFGRSAPRSSPAARAEPPSPRPAEPAPSGRAGSGHPHATRETQSAQSPQAQARISAVALAATAPRRCSAGTPFVAALSAYVEAAREGALQRLAALGEADDRRITDIEAGSWRVGAPISVRLAAEGAAVQPLEHRFEWNGREQLAPFTVTVGAAAREAVVLQFELRVADVAVACLPLRVAVDVAAARHGSGAEAMQSVSGRSARSAFASYSSQDAALVAQRLSTLARWSPGLDIFQDCLDLRPGEDFKPQLADQIAARDIFLLFWSRQAAASRWVRWEFETALQRKGAEAILPMPIEDPAIAPPPPEIASRHLRDRFLMAGYALAQVQQMRAAAAGGATTGHAIAGGTGAGTTGT